MSRNKYFASCAVIIGYYALRLLACSVVVMEVLNSNPKYLIGLDVRSVGFGIGAACAMMAIFASLEMYLDLSRLVKKMRNVPDAS
ncbi:hypothetical protein [Brevibacillus sp. SYSU BS000544]|uniref:hypothetical protein n=1 Tax=Brevibacillus sp. SYSU BS000544 TaxID=3416443 RepID=UPI003CE5C7E3